jgi:MFS family permease
MVPISSDRISRLGIKCASGSSVPIVTDQGDDSYWQVVRNRPLALLIGGDMVSKVGDGMVIVALPLLTLRLHGAFNPALAVGLIEAAPFVLAVAVSLIVGLGRRRFRPRSLLAIDCTLRFVLLTGLAWMAQAGILQLWLLGIALFLGSGLRLLAVTSRRLVATELAGEEGRFAANGLLGTSDSLTTYVVGPVIGGAIATAVSPGFVLLLDGLSFIALLVVVLIAVPPGISKTANEATGSITGWEIVRRVPIATRLFAVVFFFDLFYMPIEVALPLLVRGPLHGSGAALGYLWTSFGIGAVVGAVATNHLRRVPQTALLMAIMAGWAGCVVLLAVAPNVIVASFALAVGGLVYAPFTPVVYSLMQSKLWPDQQQPVLTLWSAGLAIAAPIGLLLGGPLVQLAGIRTGIVVSAILTLALLPIAGASLRRASRRSEL